MEDRRVPIHRSGTRPILFLGADREMVLLSAGVSIIFVWMMAARGWQYIALGIGFWLVSLWFLRLLAKRDPQFRDVYLTNRNYRAYYPARSTPWRVNRHDRRSSPFAKPRKAHG
jgi:type IV secretory pathway TrbD component